MPLYSTISGSTKYTIIGSPTIENGVVSGFSSGSYVQIDTIFSFAQPLEIRFTAITSSDVTTSQLFCSVGNGNANRSFGVTIETGGKMGVAYTLNGSTWIGWLPSSYVFEGNTRYNFLIRYIPSQFFTIKVKKSTESEWTTFTKALTTPIYTSTNCPFIFGQNYQNKPFLGSIDLNETYIKVNSQSWFGKCPVRVKVRSGLTKHSVVGNPTIENGVVSNLSTGNYIALKDKIPFASADNWEMQLAIKLDNTNYGGKKIFDFRDYGDHGLVSEFATYPNRVCFGVSGVFYETNTDLSLFVANKILYIKYIFTGTEYIMLISHDKVNWTELINYQSSDKPTNSNILQGIGCSPIYGGAIPGSIFLNYCYIKLNGQYYWKGYLGVNDSFIIHTDNFSKYYTIVDGKLTWANPNIYLETDGNAYIKLPYKINSRTTFDIKAYCPPNKSSSWFFGAGVSYMQSSMILYEYNDNSNTTYFYYKAPYIDGQEDTSTGIRTSVKSNSGNPLTYKSYISNDKYFLDVVENGSTYQKTTTGWNIPSDLGHNIDYTGLFATFNTNTSVLSPHKSGIRIYKAKLWNNGINNFNLVPVPKGLLIGNFVVPSNGMWDIVTQTFYGNAGTGEFEIGGIPDDYIIEGGKMIWCNPDISLENNSNWSAYINTGIIPTNNMRLLVIAQLTDTTHTYDGNLLGSRKTAGTSEFCLWHNTNPGQGGFIYDSTWNSDTSSFGRDDIAGNKNEFRYNGSDFTINGVTARTRIGNLTNFTSEYPIYVYALNVNNTSVDSRRFHGKVYEVALWSGSIILRYLVPVPKGILIGDKIAPSNCMFDLVTQTFFENQGTGEFTIGGLSGDYIFVGDDVVWCNDSTYLKCNGAQYFDSGFSANQDTKVVIDYTAAGSGTQALYCSRTNTSLDTFTMFRPIATSSTRFDYNKGQYTISNAPVANTRYKIIADKNKCYIDGVLKYTATESIFQSSYSMIFGCSTYLNSNYNNWAYHKYHNIQLYNNDHLIRYFIPVTTNMQISGTTIPAPGMWDMVTKKYYPNEGTGSFIYGKD